MPLHQHVSTAPSNNMNLVPFRMCNKGKKKKKKKKEEEEIPELTLLGTSTFKTNLMSTIVCIT